MEPSNLDKWRFSLYCAMYFLLVVNRYTTKIFKLDKLSKIIGLDLKVIQFVLVILVARISMGF